MAPGTSNQGRGPTRWLGALVVLLLLAGGLWWGYEQLGPSGEPEAANKPATGTPEATSTPAKRPKAEGVPPERTDSAPAAKADKPADPAAEAPPSTDEDEDEDEPKFVRDEDVYVWSRLKGKTSKFYRKAKPDSSEILQLWRGQLIQVVSDAPVEIEGENGPIELLPAKVSDATGFVEKGAIDIEPNELPDTPDNDSLWAKVRAAVGDPTIPEDCPTGLILLDFSPNAPGLELLIYSIADQKCRSAIGVFGLTGAEPDLIGYFSSPFMEYLDAFPYAGGPAFVEVLSHWFESTKYSGGNRYLLRLASVPGPMEVAFETVDYVIDNRKAPATYTLSMHDKLDPDGDGAWLMASALTLRKLYPGPKTVDELLSETVAAFDGTRFVSAPRPPGVAPLPAPPPSFEDGKGEVIDPDQ